MQEFTYSVKFIPEKEGGYTVIVPALRGCITEGETLEEAEQMAREAIALYIEVLQDQGEPIPRETKPFFKMISVTMRRRKPQL